jgi:tetratricopeptide (TPR) repeat protein
MLRLGLIILLFTLTQLGFAQKKQISSDELLFEKGLLLQEMVDHGLYLDDTIKGSIKIKADYAAEIKEEVLEKALAFYNELIESFPKSKLLFRALNNKGFIELSLEDTAEARKTFLTILNSSANDKDKGGVGAGIMGEPYANYKNRAAKALASICMQGKNWEEALTFLDETKRYPYMHYCGVESAADEIYMAELYAQCYLALHDYEKAYAVLLPNILENGLASNSNLVDTAYNALLKTYDKASLKKQFELAFQNIKTETIKQGKYEYRIQYITFLNTRITLDYWQFDLTHASIKENEIDELCKNFKFYKLLSN